MPGLSDVLGLYQMFGPQAQNDQQIQQAQLQQLLQQFKLGPQKQEEELGIKSREADVKGQLADAALMRSQAAQEAAQGKDVRNQLTRSTYLGDLSRGDAQSLSEAHALAPEGDVGLQAREKERTQEAWTGGKDYKGTDLLGPEYQKWVFSHYGTPVWNEPSFQPHVDAVKKLYPNVFGQPTPATPQPNPQQVPQTPEQSNQQLSDSDPGSLHMIGHLFKALQDHLPPIPNTQYGL